VYRRGVIICSNPPFPEGDGGRTAIRQDIISVLQRNPHIVWDVIVLWSEDVITTANWLEKQKNIHNYWIFDKPTFNPFNLLKAQPEHIARFLPTNTVKEVINVLHKSNYHSIILNGIYSGALVLWVDTSLRTRVIYRSHNIEYLLWQQILASDVVTTFQVPFSLYALNEARKYKKLEPTIWRHSNQIWSIGYHDLLMIRRENESVKWLLPDLSHLGSLHREDVNKFTPTAFLLTSYDWFPNKLGLLFWIKSIFPHISKRFSHWRFVIGGKGTEALYSFSQENLEVKGWIDEPGEYFRDSFVFFVPVWISSGVRIKVIEALLHGKLIVSTFEGIKGLPLVKWKHYIPVDQSPQSWVDALRWIEIHREKAMEIANKGRRFIMDIIANHSEPIIG